MNRQFTINDVFLPGITGGEPDRVRQAFHAPDLLSGAEVGQRDSAAEQLGMSYGEADAGWDDASTELKIRKAETVPGADKWVQDAPENVTFLEEDADGLMAVYQSLQDSGFLSQDDLDEGTAQEIAQGGNGTVMTLERARLANERTDIGWAVKTGAMEPEEARARLSSIDSRMAALAKRRGDVSGFYSFMEQGYRMATRDLPHAGRRALEGGLTGASAGAIAGTIAGSAVPVVGNLTGAVGGSVAGGIAGVGAGLARGMYESAQHMEEANFLADLLNEKDDAGNWLDVDEIREKAQLYGMGSALVEMAGDALSVGASKLIAPFLKTAAANLGGKSLQLFTKDAIKSAIKNKQSWPVMRRFLLGMGAGAAAEGAEEAVQEGVSASIEAWLKNSLNEQGKAYFRDEQEGLFSAETWAAMRESGLEGAKVGAWFVLLPGIAQLFVDTVKVQESRQFEQKLKVVSANISKSKTAEMAPARLDDYLKKNGLYQTVYLPADAVWQMQEQGTELAGPLGWTKESLEEAASLGHDIAVPLSRLFARLDEGTRNALAPLVRADARAMNAFEAEDPSAFLQGDLDAIEASIEEYEFEQAKIDYEKDRVRSQLTEVVRNSVTLKNQIATSTDPETSVGSYVDALMQMIEAENEQLQNTYSTDKTYSFWSKLNFEGLIRGADGKLYTREELQDKIEQEVKAEEDRPFWDNVWGRLDADSLKRDFPEARRELARAHGTGLFAKKGEGLAVDELADILKNAGWLDKDADSSTLVEKLKSKKRPKARKAGKAALNQTAEVVVREGIERKPDSAAAKVVRLESAELPAFENLQQFSRWVREELAREGTVTIQSTGQVANFTSSNVKASLKRARSEKHRKAYLALRDMVENAEYDQYVAPDERHPDKGGQDIYHSALVLDGRLYAVTIRLDVVSDRQRTYEGGKGATIEEDVRYKDHKLAEIEIAPALYHGWAENGEAVQQTGAITEVSLGVLRGNVKPSGFDNGTLYQFIGEAGAARLDRQDKALQMLDRLAVARSMEKNGESPARIKLAVGWERGADGLWRYELDDSEAEYRKYGDARLLSDSEYQRMDELWKQIEASFYGGPDVDESVYEEFDALNEKWSEAAQARRERVESNTGLLSDILYHPTLFKAYPRLADIPVTFEDISAEGQTVFIPQALGKPRVQKIVIREGRRQYASDDQLLSILMHEVQHVIQNAEDFAMGGNSRDLEIDEDGMVNIGALLARQREEKAREIMASASPEMQEKLREMENLRQARDFDKLGELEAALSEDEYLIWDEYSWLLAEAKELKEEGKRVHPFVAYKQLAGEVEARNTQKRLSMDTEERANSLAAETEDVAREDQLIIWDGLAAFSEAPLEQRAWHGTPHDFDAFTLQAIGTGEGVQAHGWGLYFAKNKTTAKRYKAGLSKGKGGRLFEVDIPENNVLLDEQKAFSAQHKNVQKLILEAIQAMSESEQDVFYKRILGSKLDDSEAYNKATAKLDRERLFLKAITGISDSKFVRIWHRKTLLERGYSEEQIDELWADTEKAKAEIQKFLPEVQKLEAEQKVLKQKDDERRASFLSEAKNNPEAAMAKVFGEELYDAIAGAVSKENHPDFRAASEALNAVGIKGITYEGGRDGRCFVVFDDKAIEVIDKYYAMQADGAQSYQTGAIIPLDNGDWLIRLFRGANLSTLAHEISHAVHLEMERLDSEGKGTDALKRDLDTLRRWQAKFDDEAALRAEYDRYYKGLYGVEFDELDAVGKLAVKQRAQREMVARGFELYLREGEAPTPGMEAVFRRMGKWMKRVYQNASQLDVEINDEVRGVFDRWLASEEDIAAAAAANDIHGFTTPLLDSLGLQGADRLELEGMINDAMGKASDALRRDRARYRRDHIQQWRDEVEQELADDPVYRARAAMRRTPIDLDAVVDTYGQELADELRVKLPASMKKGGDNPELLAFDYGFDNAGQMIRAIVNRPGSQERRKELLAQKMKDADAQFAAEDYLFEQEELRQREDKVGETLYRLELNSKTAMGRPVSPSQQDFEDFGSAEKNRWKIAREQLRTLVSNLLDEKEAQAAINPDSYRRAAAKAMREERKAILAKDWAEAVKQNYLARVNMEAAYQAGKRRDMVNKLRRQAKRFLASATPDTRARFAVFGLSQKVSLFDPTMKMVQNAADKGMDDIRAFLEKMKDEGFYTVDAAIPETLFDGQKQNWQLMDWKDLQPYLEGMAVLMHMERESRKANSEAAKAEWRAEMDGLAASILALNPHRNPHADQKKRLDIVRFLKEVHASHLKAETICLLLDGDQDMGPVWRAVIAPINRAQADRDRRMKKARDDMKRLFGVYEASEWVDIRGKRITVPSLGRGLTKEQMLVIALNSGNDSNLERLRGMGYKDNEIREIIDLLDERDVRFVQSVWDYLETFRKESFDLEEKLTGVRPQAIEAKPLQTRFGELRGGYYPVSYDPQESSKPIDAESLGTLTGSMMPAVDHGSMKQRTATGLGAPLKLTLEVVPNHVAKTLHMLAFREPVRQVARVLNDKAVNAAIEATMGVEISKALKSWLHYVAGERPGVNGWSKALSMLRKNSALYSMGVKLTTILAQMTGLLASTAEIGPRWVAAGLADTYCRQNPFVVYRETAALSPMMENRMRSVDRDLYEMSTGLMAKGSTNRVLDKFVKIQHAQEQYAFLPVGFVQMAFADLPTWRGAYAKALHEGRSQTEAIEYADAIVTRTQTGGADKDLAAVQRGQELGKIMTQFYSYFSALYQLYARRMTMLKRSHYSREAWARLGTLFLLTGFAEPILSAIFTFDTPEDDEDWWVWGAKKVFFNPWNMVVGVRDVFGAVESLVDGYGGKSRAASLLNDSIDTGVRFLSQLAKGEDMDPRAALKSGWKGVGLLTGIVNAQELLFLEAFWDWLEDTNPDFEWADLVRRKK